ncbi:hypothetical protein [Rhizobium ecuadorense]|uniref:hypothetical protein n=1 Tax=Rhizobium ecuadorense TaxID=1671795 RepID=UPI00128F24C1|nr:hypothetical protein [Rhizobium ecuadorense]
MASKIRSRSIASTQDAIGSINLMEPCASIDSKASIINTIQLLMGAEETPVVKLVKISDAWYTEFSGNLFTRESPTEDITQWQAVRQLSSDSFDKIKSEFPGVTASFSAAADGATYESNADVPQHVQEVAMMGGGGGPDKYVTYHAPAVRRAREWR